MIIFVVDVIDWFIVFSYCLIVLCSICILRIKVYVSCLCINICEIIKFYFLFCCINGVGRDIIGGGCKNWLFYIDFILYFIFKILIFCLCVLINYVVINFELWKCFILLKFSLIYFWWEN